MPLTLFDRLQNVLCQEKYSGAIYYFLLNCKNFVDHKIEMFRMLAINYTYANRTLLISALQMCSGVCV